MSTTYVLESDDTFSGIQDIPTEQSGWHPVVSFFVPGVPKPGGSKKVIPLMRHGKPILRASGSPVFNVTDDCAKNADWRNAVAFWARRAWGGRELLAEAVAVEVTFTMPRPKFHFGTGKNLTVLKASAPEFHEVKPDGTKLWRAAEDALTGILWSDDARIVRQTVEKRYGEKPGAGVVVYVRRKA